MKEWLWGSIWEEWGHVGKCVWCKSKVKFYVTRFQWWGAITLRIFKRHTNPRTCYWKIMRMFYSNIKWVCPVTTVTHSHTWLRGDIAARGAADYSEHHGNKLQYRFADISYFSSMLWKTCCFCCRSVSSFHAGNPLILTCWILFSISTYQTSVYLITEPGSLYCAKWRTYKEMTPHQLNLCLSHHDK